MCALMPENMWKSIAKEHDPSKYMLDSFRASPYGFLYTEKELSKDTVTSYLKYDSIYRTTFEVYDFEDDMFIDNRPKIESLFSVVNIEFELDCASDMCKVLLKYSFYGAILHRVYSVNSYMFGEFRVDIRNIVCLFNDLFRELCRRISDDYSYDEAYVFNFIESNSLDYVVRNLSGGF